MNERAEDKDGALYNLKKDPDEKVNLYNIKKHTRVIKRLEKLAQKWEKARQA